MDGTRPKCKRCGKCCESSAPALHEIDLPLVIGNHLDWDFLYTIRKGELVWDNIENENIKVSKEMIKVKEGQHGCVFYQVNKKACQIYESRPVECRALFCQDTSGFFRVYQTRHLTREDILGDLHIMRLVKEHEKRCSYGELEYWISRIEESGQKAVQKLIKMLRFDHEIRLLVSDRIDCSLNRLDLLFGRPMSRTISNYGLQVIQETDGSFLLTRAHGLGQ